MGLGQDSFIQRRKYTSLKYTEELYVMKIMNDAKFLIGKTFRFKTDMKNLTNFDLSTQKSQKIALSWAPFDQSI